MNNAEAERILNLKSPYTKEEVAQAWIEARNRATVEGRLSLEQRRLLPTRLKGIDEAKTVCEQSARVKPATPPGSRWWRRAIPRRYASRKATPFFPFAARAKRRATPFSPIPSQQAPTTGRKLNLGKTILVSFLLSIPLSILATVTIGVLLQRNALSAYLPIQQHSSAKEQEMSQVMIAGDSRLDIELVNKETGTHYRFKTPMKEPIACQPGPYEIRVKKDGEVKEICYLRLHQSVYYEVHLPASENSKR